MLPIASSDDRYSLSGLLVPARVLPPTRPSAPWAPFFVPAATFPLTSRGHTHLYWLLGSSVQKQALRDGERSAFPACKHSRVGVESDIVKSILMLEHRSFHVMEKLLLWLVFLPLSCG